MEPIQEECQEDEAIKITNSQKSFRLPAGFKLPQVSIDKLGAMNRKQRRAWFKKKQNRHA